MPYAQHANTHRVLWLAMRRPECKASGSIDTLYSISEWTSLSFSYHAFGRICELYKALDFWQRLWKHLLLQPSTCYCVNRPVAGIFLGFLIYTACMESV